MRRNQTSPWRGDVFLQAALTRGDTRKGNHSSPYELRSLHHSLSCCTKLLARNDERCATICFPSTDREIGMQPHWASSVVEIRTGTYVEVGFRWQTIGQHHSVPS